MKTIYRLYATTARTNRTNLSVESVFPPLPSNFIVEGENETECFNKIITFFKTLYSQFDGEIREDISNEADILFVLFKQFDNGYFRRAIRISLICKVKDEICYL